MTNSLSTLWVSSYSAGCVTAGWGRPFFITLWLCSLCLLGCKKNNQSALFVKLEKGSTGIDFRNLIIEKETFNIFKYQYFYNGGGVAAGDFNNDGLADLVFTGNMVKNRFYLNKGGLEFQDITTKTGISEKEGWCTGVTTVDINGDGWLDLYICRAGYPFDHLRRNLLYINNGDLTFTEKAAEYGLDDPAHSTQAGFFDYDNDGDLDMFLLNHSEVEYSRGSLEVFQIRATKKPEITNKLFRNDQGHFTDVTAAAGITSNVLTFSLGLNITDINGDGWQDLLIGNDFNEPDYLFINQGDGTFADKIADYLDHTSMFSMGGDVADINNDGLLDWIQLDMLPETNFLQKMHSGADNFDKVSALIQNGFFNQYSRNMLQINNGDGTFSECGQMAGVSNTDWSWSPLFLDFDNDGNKDLFISNGYLRDHTDMDFLKFTADEVKRMQSGQDHIGFEQYLAKMPPINQPNYFFLNRGDLHFDNMNAAWGLQVPSVSQGSLYADLDNDGDLDIVTNMSNEAAGFYENKTNEIVKNSFLRVALHGDKLNPSGIGSKITVFCGKNQYFQEQQPVRGFQSSVDPVLCFGLGQATAIDSLRIVWNTGALQVLKNIPSNQLLQLKKTGAQKAAAWPHAAAHPRVQPLPNAAMPVHKENAQADFHTQSLMPWYCSQEGPALAVADLDGNGWPDLYLGGAAGTSGALYFGVSEKTGRVVTDPFLADKNCEDQAACFFDADGDGDLDLYVASGSYEMAPGAPELRDRLYMNLGNGRFAKSGADLPAFNATCAAPADADGDGDMDLFVGAFVTPGAFPLTEPSALLINDGNGRFTLQAVATEGLVKDAVWADVTGDALPELVVAAEWAPIQVFHFENGVWKKMDQIVNASSSGLWQSIAASDLDGDGDLDLVAGNMGLNNQMTASAEHPLQLYFDDFDKNGSIDPILCRYYSDKIYPMLSREDMIAQLRFLGKKYPGFKEFAEASLTDIFTPEQMKTCRKMEAAVLETSVFINDSGHFQRKSLPRQAQIAPVCAIVAQDLNGDKKTDLILAGNIENARVKLGRLDGNHGQWFEGLGNGAFEKIPDSESALNLRDEVRMAVFFQSKNGAFLLFGLNDRAPRWFKIIEK